ncbi:aminotransferase class V-fold PLP-dependent enzyme [Sphingomonas sp. RS6]
MGGPYLLAHSAGCMPVAVADAVRSGLLAPWQAGGAQAWDDWLAEVDAFRGALAALLGGSTADWCPQAGVSAAIFRFLSGLPRIERRDVILASHEAFPSIAYALQGLAAIGLRLELLDGDPSLPATWDRAGDADIAAVVAMHVHSNSGRISPIAEIVGRARSGGAAIVVDIAQSAGVVPIDVAAWGVDAVAGSALKWLCGGPGAGFLWVNPQIVDRLEPIERGWFSHEAPFEMDPRRFRFAPDARRFWGGTPAVAPSIVAAAALATIGQIGVAWIARHNAALKQQLLESVPGLAGAMPENGSQGCTLCLALGAESEAALREAGVGFDRRGPILRLSFAAWNDAEDVERVAVQLRGAGLR